MKYTRTLGEIQSTCSNIHLYKDDHSSKTTNAESAQANSGTIVTIEDDHLSNATSDHFFCLPNEKKPVHNNQYKTLPSEEMGNKHKAAMHNIIFTILMQSLFNVYKNWAIYSYIKLCKIIR